jgi:hypothetical protein
LVNRPRSSRLAPLFHREVALLPVEGWLRHQFLRATIRATHHAQTIYNAAINAIQFHPAPGQPHWEGNRLFFKKPGRSSRPYSSLAARDRVAIQF